MKFVKSKYSSIMLMALLLSSCLQQEVNTNNVKVDELSGPYLGQELPDTTPRVFAPGIVSTELYERDLAISPGGDEIYYSVLTRSKGKTRTSIICIKKINNVWTKPEVAPFSGQYSDIEPFIQHDNKRFYFVSTRPMVDSVENEFTYNMWFMERKNEEWSKPIPVDEPINGNGSVFFPSITKSGTMYFTCRFEDNSEYIFRSKYINGQFSEPEKLPEIINQSASQFNAFISPDESFLIVPTVVESNTFGNSDYYVSFRDKNDNWSELINLGNKINTSQWDFSPSLSPDGKYFFFQRESWTEDIENMDLNYSDLKGIQNGGGDIYWVDASVITNLNPYE